MVYEQLTFDGCVEVTDERTGELRARKIVLTCEKECRLCGKFFMEGEEIEVTFPAILDSAGHKNKDGPWHPGGYTSRWIRSNAVQIREMSRGKVLMP